MIASFLCITRTKTLLGILTVASERKKTQHHLPHVLVIGPPKSGSSALFGWLSRKGGLCPSEVYEGEPSYYNKESHFFDNHTHYERGIASYAKRWDHCNSTHAGKFKLDATPDTISYPERVRETFEAAGGDQVKKVKIIAILREPVSRELSMYNHMVSQCQQTSCPVYWPLKIIKDGAMMPFDDFVRERLIPFLNWNLKQNGDYFSMYPQLLTRWFDVFDRDQILILNYNESKTDPNNFRERVQEFLGIEIHGKIDNVNAQTNPLKLKTMSHEAKQNLTLFFEPQNEKLYQLLKLHPGPSMEERSFRRFQEIKD